MTVSTLAARVEYVENGVTLTHPVPFQFHNPDDLIVSRILDGVRTTLKRGPDYSVAGGGGSAGSITKTSGGAIGTVLRVARRTARVQPTDYTPGDRFPAESHEGALDRSVMMIQEQDEDIAVLSNRALLAGHGEAAGVLPPMIDGDGKFLARDLKGRWYWSNGTGADGGLRDDLAADGGRIIGVKALGAGAVRETAADVFARLALSPEQFGAKGGGADDTIAVQMAINWAALTGAMLDGHGATFRLTSKINIPLTGALRMRNVNFLVDHPGAGIGQATAGGGANVVARGYFENVRLLAKQNATVAWDCVTFQYCQWINCFVGTAGGGAKFGRAWRLSNVAYWNTFYSPEVEAISNYAWDLSDANDTRFFMPRHVDFSGTPLGSVIFSGGCSGIDFFGISFETAFTGANGAVDFATACEQIRFFGGRIERRAPGTTDIAIRLNGSTSCKLDGIYILGGFTSATDVVGDNYALLFASGFSSTRMGGGQFFVSTNTVNADTPGGMIYNKLRNRFTGYADGPRDFAMSPAVDPLDMNGHPISNVGGLLLSSGATNPGAGKVAIGSTTAANVGAAGGASALPATPLGYLIAFVGTTQVKIPYYNA